MKVLIGIIIIVESLTSCQPQNREFVEHKELSPLVEWQKKDIIEFKVPIESARQ